jgi:hypothetical protein
LRSLRVLVACLILALFGGQQAALAHLYGHLAGHAGETVLAEHAGEDEHPADRHACLRCLEACALDAWLPSAAFAHGQPASPPRNPAELTPGSALAQLAGGFGRGPPAPPSH